MAWGSILSAAGTAVGAYFGGPAGAAAGGAIGGAVGGAIDGGPSSGGGITSIGGSTTPGSGVTAGVEARGYYDEAFPGTNPWERLGAGNPMGAVMSAGIQADTQRKNVEKQIASQKYIVDRQVQGQQNVAVINAAGAANVAGIHAGPAGRQATAAETQAASGVRGATVREREAAVGERHVTVAEDQVKINKNLQRLKSMEIDIKSAEMAKDPATAALRAEAAKMFQAGLREREIHEKLAKQYPALLALGTAKEVGEFLSKLVSGALGSRVRAKIPKRTSVR